METPVAEYSENTKREAFGNRHLTEDQNVFNSMPGILIK